MIFTLSPSFFRINYTKGIANILGDSSLCCAPFTMTNLCLLDIILLFELIQPLLLHH